MTLAYNTPQVYYKPSGKFSIVSLIIALCGALVLSTLITVVYAYLNHYVRFAGILSILFCFGYCAGLGGINAMLLRWAKVRNSAVAAGFALAIGLLSLYLCWAVWEFVVLRAGGIEAAIDALLTRPDAMWDLAQLINENGTWGLRGSTMTGVPLWIIWGLEAAGIIGASVVIPARILRENSFCETCDRWCTNMPSIHRLEPGDDAAARAALERHDLTYLEQLQPLPPDAFHYYRVDLHRCPECDQMHMMSLHRVSVTLDKEGKRSDTAKGVVDRLLISRDEAATIRDMHPPPAMPAIPPPPADAAQT